MTLFVALAALLAALALAFLLPPLLRVRGAETDRRAEANAETYRGELAELEAARARGALGEDEYRRAVRELEHRILAEAAAPAAAPNVERRVGTAVAIALLLPLGAALGYVAFGEPAALDPANREASAPTHAEFEAMVERLWERVQRAPEDAEGWALVARALASLGQHERAAQAFAQAARHKGDDPDLLADWADALALARGRRLEGQPLALVRRALALDPQHVKALALAGAAEYQAGNHAAAVEHWQRLLALVPPQSDFARQLGERLEQARQLAAEAAAAKPAAPKGQGRGALTGVVRLDPNLAARVTPGDTVFVFARPADGGGMPLAVARATVAELPWHFRLDDSMAIAAGTKLSTQPKVIVVARVSRSGDAAPRKGDIEGASAPVAPDSSGVRVVLDRVIE
jgi:cytochrome c-type biogenesis protein CcmH